jgi:hypothetical protein
MPRSLKSYASFQSSHQVQCRVLLDVVVTDSPSVLKLLARIYDSLLIIWYTRLHRHFLFHDENPVCTRYFRDHSDISFEIENLVRNIRSMEASLRLDDNGDRRSTLMNDWYALYGTERARWLLIALTVTLGHNFGSVQALPESFEVLLQSTHCYIS